MSLRIECPGNSGEYGAHWLLLSAHNYITYRSLSIACKSITWYMYGLNFEGLLLEIVKKKHFYALRGVFKL